MQACFLGVNYTTMIVAIYLNRFLFNFEICVILIMPVCLNFNRTCEICHSIARNVYGTNEELTEHLSDGNNATTATTLNTPAPSAEPRRFWHGHRFLNFLLACMVFAFVISWLFHFNVPSS